MSKTPTTASSPAAVVTGIPWSWAAGTKCGCTSPFVDIPQMKNPPASSQNGRDRTARPRPRSAACAAPARCGSASSAGVPP